MCLINNQKFISMKAINSNDILMLEKLALVSAVKALPKQWKEEIYTQVDILSFNAQRNKNENQG